MDFNHEFLEVADIIPAFVPVDMQTGNNNGLWVNMKYVRRLVCVLYKGSGTAGDDPVITLKQATTNAGANSKALTFNRIRTKANAALASLTQFALTTQTPANTFTTTSAANPALIAVEITATDLDMNNGFNFVQLSIPDTGTNAQLGCAFYIAYGLRYLQGVPNPVPNELS